MKGGNRLCQTIIVNWQAGRSSGSKSWLLLSALTTTKSTAACHWTVTVQCWGSVLPTAHYADISASLSCRKMQDWKPHSRKHRPLIANNAASCSQLTENGCTAHSAVPKKLAVSRQQHGCVSIGKNSNRCNVFALGKPCAARLFWWHFCIGRVLIPFARF